MVEKSVIDLFGDNDNDGNCSDLHFVGPLEKMNLVFTRNSWVNQREDLLKLPEPNY